MKNANTSNNASNRMGSIARKISMEFWLRELANFMLIDLLLVGIACSGFFIWCEDKGVTENYEVYLGELWQIAKIPAIVILIFEGLLLFSNLFATKMVRKTMRPLNDIAIKTEELSNPANIEAMEKAISDLDPEQPGAKVATSDKELQSLEIAINNLIERMRESHRVQARFVSDASHELRTPIAVIQGYVNMLDRWGKDDEQILQESIEALKNESEHMKNLVEQLLFLARGDSGRNTIHKENFDLNEIVREVLDESAMIDENHVYSFKGDEAKPIEVVGDIAMIKQSIRIFVQNAAKYSDRGAKITLGAGLSEDGTASYFVQDEGNGMAESEVVHVFERFYRSDTARSSSEGGTGLGMSIAKWIVDAHGGVIEVLSRPEFGTRVRVKLPKAVE